MWRNIGRRSVRATRGKTSSFALNRRLFLAGSATAAFRPFSRLKAQATPKSTDDHQPSYLALQPFIAPGADEFASEVAAMRLRNILHQALQTGNIAVTPGLVGISPLPSSYRGQGPDLASGVFAAHSNIAQGWQQWVESLGRIRRAEFYPLPRNSVRFEVASNSGGTLTYRVGHWTIKVAGDQIGQFEALEEHVATSAEAWFRDVTAHAIGAAPEVRDQFARGVPFWRSHLDPATGIDVYGGNGISVGDIDGDGADEVYVCQPGGLPNRLLKFQSDGTLRDLTHEWGVGLLDDSSAALFLDLRNSGRQDLVVLRSGGPVLFVNEGTRFRLRPDAFRFSRQPLGGFTGMAAADFDRDGKLDLYLCCYVYFQSEAQFTYPAPYHDAQNGPPNFLFRNRLTDDGQGYFEDCTAETGIDQNNNRFSFAPSWCDFNGDGWPDLYVANDFGRKNLYVNRGGKFADQAREAGVEDLGPGMSAHWFDYDGDGRPDLYVANMWSDAGQRINGDPKFTPAQQPDAHEAYARHTRGNSLYRNRGDGTFEDVTFAQQAQFGRWAWSSCGLDLDNDGHPELFGTCGMLTNRSNEDLMGFFWRQVVAKSPASSSASTAYQNGWNAINQFVREDYSWNGHEPNVFHVRRGNRYFDFSGVSGLDFADDSRAFTITDFDGDGRPDIILKSRLGPQLRLLQNNCAGTHQSVAIRLEGTKSNRDAIGARVRVGKQTKWLEAGSGFLSQHSKRMIFGLGDSTEEMEGEILWPSGLQQPLSRLIPGHTYFVREGVTEVRRVAYRPHTPRPSSSIQPVNHMELEDTWLLEAVPLPELHEGPALLTLVNGGRQSEAGIVVDLGSAGPERRQHFEIFRRYLFDYRAPLTYPTSFLLNGDGHVVKVYRGVPTPAAVRKDLVEISHHAERALPYPGKYVVPAQRDFAKLGIAFLMAGYPAQALPYLNEVLRRSPDNTRVLTLVGRIHLDSHNYFEAEKAYRAAVSLARATPEAFYGLAMSLARQNKLEEARPYFEHAIEERPDYSDAVNDLGALYVEQGKLNDAVAAFQYGIRVAPDEDILYLNLGRTYAKMAQLDRARQVMQQLLDRKPDSQIARNALQELNGRN